MSYFASFSSTLLLTLPILFVRESSWPYFKIIPEFFHFLPLWILISCFKSSASSGLTIISSQVWYLPCFPRTDSQTATKTILLKSKNTSLFVENSLMVSYLFQIKSQSQDNDLFVSSFLTVDGFSFVSTLVTDLFYMAILVICQSCF